MILVTVNWRGALNVEHIRTFTDKQEAEARSYYESHSRNKEWHIARGYRTYSNKPPTLIWSCAKDKKGK